MALCNIPIQMNRQCYYQLGSHHIKYSSKEQEKTCEGQGPPKPQKCPPCNLPTPRNTRNWCERVNVTSPYSMLMCSCHECTRMKLCDGEKMDLPQRGHLTNVTGIGELRHEAGKLEENYNDYFCTTYQLGYSEDVCMRGRMTRGCGWGGEEQMEVEYSEM
ncbi:uncharacterized protein [Hetaerina americana]|uniref:uncharacterized protein isoform X2 n=2 Tax=Hetaerina americana TaxID=62018 RepID=UPI003A7F31E0